MTLGILSDTHDRLPNGLGRHFAGVDRIVHAGDVCHPDLIVELSLLAPVTVVAGNNDHHPGWRPTEVFEWAGRRVLVHHIVQPGRPSAEVRDAMRRARPDIVIFGHTHQPFCQVVDGVLYLNPGSAGQSRRGVPLSVCLLQANGSGLETKFIPVSQPERFR